MRGRISIFHLLGSALIALALGQIFGLESRHLGHGIMQGLIFGAGGAALLAFALINRAWGGAEPAREVWSPKTIILLIGSVVLAGLVATEALIEQTSPLGRLMLWGPDTWSTGSLEAPRVRGVLTTLLSGTLLIALGTLAVTAICGAGWALWAGLRGSREGPRQRAVDTIFKPAYAILWLAGSVPYLVPALLVRAHYGDEVTVETAHRWLANGTGTFHAFAGFLGIRPALLFAVIFLGLQSGHGLVTWLRRLVEENRRSESYRLARLIGRSELRTHLRDVVWLRKRSELVSLLIGSMASACLIDMISNALMDSFHKATFPLYPSLGSVMFLVESGHAPKGMTVVVLAMIVASTILIAVASLPEFPRFAELRRRENRSSLHVGDQLLIRDMPTGSVKAPAFNWVLGTSGAGKSSYLRAYTGEREGKNVIYVPQDPDEASSPVLSTRDLALFAGPLREEVGRRLMSTRDGRIQQGFDDPFTPAAALSRGERQRLIFILALSRFLAGTDKRLLLDEFTSAQDEERARALVTMLGAARIQGNESRVFIVSHDPLAVSTLGRCLTEDPSRDSPVTDVIYWVSANKELHRVHMVYDPATKMARPAEQLVLPEELERFRKSAAWIYDHRSFAEPTAVTVKVLACAVEANP